LKTYSLFIPCLHQNYTSSHILLSHDPILTPYNQCLCQLHICQIYLLVRCDYLHSFHSIAMLALEPASSIRIIRKHGQYSHTSFSITYQYLYPSIYILRIQIDTHPLWIVYFYQLSISAIYFLLLPFTHILSIPASISSLLRQRYCPSFWRHPRAVDSMQRLASIQVVIWPMLERILLTSYPSLSTLYR
jgi:hypothetical protein